MKEGDIEMTGIFQGFIKVATVIVLSVAFAALLIFGGAYLSMLFWNMFCGYVHLPEIGYWQMWGLMMFLEIIATIFKSNAKSEN